MREAAFGAIKFGALTAGAEAFEFMGEGLQERYGGIAGGMARLGGGLAGFGLRFGAYRAAGRGLLRGGARASGGLYGVRGGRIGPPVKGGAFWNKALAGYENLLYQMPKNLLFGGNKPESGAGLFGLMGRGAVKGTMGLATAPLKIAYGMGELASATIRGVMDVGRRPGTRGALFRQSRWWNRARSRAAEKLNKWTKGYVGAPGGMLNPAAPWGYQGMRGPGILGRLQHAKHPYYGALGAGAAIGMTSAMLGRGERQRTGWVGSGPHGTDPFMRLMGNPGTGINPRNFGGGITFANNRNSRQITMGNQAVAQRMVNMRRR
jgi:hypothetical protein